MQHEMNPDLQSFDGSEDHGFLHPSHQPTKISESDHPGSQTGQVDTFFEQPSVPEYIDMEYQTAADLQYQPTTNRMANHTGSMIGDLTAGAFAVPYNTERNPIINILDHDAEQYHSGQDGDFELEGTSYAHEKGIADSVVEAFGAYTSQIHHGQMIMTNHVSPHEPWTPLSGSLQDSMDASRPMYDSYGRASYTGSPRTLHQHGFPIEQAPESHPGLHCSIDGDNATTAQRWHRSASSCNRRHQVPDFSGAPLSLYHHDGNSVMVTPPQSRFAELESRDISRNEFLSANGYATPSHGMPPSTPSVLSETPSSVSHTLYCHQEGCSSKFTGKYRRGTLQRHLRLKHQTRQGSLEQERRYFCQVRGCGKAYLRQDALLKHQRNKHQELGISPPMSRK